MDLIDVAGAHGDNHVTGPDVILYSCHRPVNRTTEAGIHVDFGELIHHFLGKVTCF